MESHIRCSIEARIIRTNRESVILKRVHLDPLVYQVHIDLRAAATQQDHTKTDWTGYNVDLVLDVRISVTGNQEDL